MRPRTLLLIALAVLLGAVVAVPPALATASEAKLEVNENCVEPNWPCWATPGSSQPALKVTIARGDSVAFADSKTAANVAWTGAVPTTCESEVPVAPTPPKTGWTGKCTFEKAGIYRFESSTLFKDFYNDYTKYEIVVEGTPTDKTTSAGGETQTEAMLNGSIDPEGNTVEYHFEYEGPGVTGKQPTPTAMLSAADFTSHIVSAQVTGLKPGMTYHFQLVATYGAGKTTVPGGVETLSTLAAKAPTATTSAASGLTETEATLKGNVDPEGGAEVEYFFEWGVASGVSYEHTTPARTLPEDGADHAVSAHLPASSLIPGTEYHFRVVAKNSLGGPIDGNNMTFKSLAPPPSKKSEPPSEPPSSPPTTTTPSPTSPILPSLLSKPDDAPGPPLTGSPSLRSAQRGMSVKGSLDISQSGAGGRLEVDLLAKSASLAAHRSGSVRVGRLVHTSVSAGKVSFTVALTARGRSALHRHNRLALTVKIVLAPPQGVAVTVTRSVLLHA